MYTYLGNVFIHCKAMVQPEWSLNHGLAGVLEVDSQHMSCMQYVHVCNLGHTPNGEHLWCIV